MVWGHVLRRVLLIRLSQLGDVVLTEPVIRALKSWSSEVWVELVTDAPYAEMMARATAADAVVAYPRRGQDKGAMGPGRVRQRLSARHFDLVVDLSGKLRSRLLARSVGAGHRRILKKRSLLNSLKSLFGREPPLANRHAVDMYLSVLDGLGIELDGFDRRPRFRWPRFSSAPGPGLRIGLAPCATHATKRWPLERFSVLADHLSRHLSGPAFVLIGGPQDQSALQSVGRGATEAQFDDLGVAHLPVEGLVDALATLDLLISVDTGPAHIAAALGVPVVALFGPTSPTRWGPLGTRHRVVQHPVDCSPCSNFGGPQCPRPDRSHACLEALSTETVLKVVLDVLGGSGA